MADSYVLLIVLPAPRVKKGKWSKERVRTQSGKSRKKTVRCKKKEIVTMGRGDARKTAVNYDKRRGGKVAYQWKTKNPEKQAKKLKQKGKRFTISTTDFEVCRNTTQKTENSGIDSEKKKS